jgi:hypothetical protein
MSDPSTHAYYMNDAWFDLPDARLVDRSVTRLVSAAPDIGGLAVLVERRSLSAGKSLRKTVFDFGVEARQRLRNYAELDTRDCEVDALPGIDVAARWTTGEGAPIYSRSLHFALGSTWLIFACETLFSARASSNACIDRIVASLRWRELDST